MNRLKRSSINMLAGMLGYAAPMLINVVATPILLVLLGEDAYGLQALVSVILGYATVMDMALDLPITKFVAEDEGRGDTKSRNRLLNNALQLYCIIGLLGMILIISSADFLARRVFHVPENLMDTTIVVFRLTGIGFFATVLGTWGRAAANGMQRYDITHIVALATSFSGMSLGLATVYGGYGVTGFVMVKLVICQIASSVTYLIVVKRLLPTFKIQLGVDRLTLQRIRNYMAYGAVNRTMGTVVSRLDQTLIGVWLGVAAVGVYSIAFMVVTSIGYMLAHMLGFFLPMASELYENNKLDQLQDIFTRATRFITALAGMFFVPLLVFGDHLVILWLGEQVASQIDNVLRLLVISAYISTLTATITNNLVIGIGKIRQFTIYTTVRSLVLCLCCLLFIKPLGLEGAGAALLLTSFVDVFYFITVTKRYLHVAPVQLFEKALLRPIALTLVVFGMALALRSVTDSWLGLICVVGAMGIFFVTVGYWVGVFGDTERRAILGPVSYTHLTLPTKRIV